MPTSVLNVKTHKDIRRYIVEKTSIEKIQIFKKPFTAVLTDAVSLSLSKQKTNITEIIENENTHQVDSNRFSKNKDNVFTLYSKQIENIIKKIENTKNFNLKECDYALGIVTGNNSKHIFNTAVFGSLPIYTGKEIQKYCLSMPKKYIMYQRDFFQQVAKDEYYFAVEKLIYKFISNKRLIFAYDANKSLILNSANLLIPKNTPIDIKGLCVLLNSNVLNFYFKNKVNQIKTLKADLQNLPIPLVSPILEKKLIEFFNKKEFEKDSEIQELIYSHYGFSDNEIKIIEDDLKYGKIKRNFE